MRQKLDFKIEIARRVPANPAPGTRMVWPLLTPLGTRTSMVGLAAPVGKWIVLTVPFTASSRVMRILK